MEKETYDKIKSELEEQELYLDENEIDTILRIAKRAQTDSEHIGIRPERCKDNDRELAFHKHWLKNNSFRAHTGQGILQALFIEHGNAMSALPNGKYILEINSRDRQVAATVVQWLGSNVGFCFLQEALKDCGYSIVRTEQQ